MSGWVTFKAADRETQSSCTGLIYKMCFSKKSPIKNRLVLISTPSVCPHYMCPVNCTQLECWSSAGRLGGDDLTGKLWANIALQNSALSQPSVNNPDDLHLRSSFNSLLAAVQTTRLHPAHQQRSYSLFFMVDLKRRTTVSGLISVCLEVWSLFTYCPQNLSTCVG